MINDHFQGLVKWNHKKSCLCLIVKVRAVSHAQFEENVKGLGLHSLQKTTYQWSQLGKKLNSAREQLKKVTWSDDSDEMMHPWYKMPTIQACMGSAFMWGCFSWSGLGSATICAPKIRSIEYTEWPGFSTNAFFLPWWQGIFKYDNEF